MADYNKNRFYWIKLSDRFIESDTVDYLMSQKDGANYVVLYQMLCLKTVNNNGVLARKLGEVLIPYDIEKITRDCKWFTVDTVRVALELYKNLGMVYSMDNGMLRIADFDRLIGSQTISAEKKQIQLENKGGGKKVEKIPPDIEIEKEKDIEIDKDIKEIKDITPSAEPCVYLPKHKHGTFNNILLTDKEYDSLQNDYKNAEQAINFLSEYIELKGYKAKSHYLALKKWVFNAIKENELKEQEIQQRQRRINGNQQKGDNVFLEIAKEEGLI